jgi:hypothetical protein
MLIQRHRGAVVYIIAILLTAFAFDTHMGVDLLDKKFE